MRSRLNSNRGISMMELMIALVVVGLLAALSVPRFDGAIKKMKFDGVGKDIVGAMRYARSAAVTLQQPHGVFFDNSNKRIVTFIDKVNLGANLYEVGDSIVRADSVSSAVEYLGTTFSYQTVMFQPDGKASASGYVIAHRSGGISRSFSISLTAGSGRAKLDYYN